MNAHGAIRNALTGADMISTSYLNDLSDADLLVRPVPGANHIAWQLGHLIASENGMTEETCPGSMPALPTGFKEKHDKDTAGSDDRNAFLSKDEYLRLYRQQREATLKALDGLSEADLDRPAPERLRAFIETIGGVFVMHSTHWLMHAGQWAVVRRKLGRNPLF
ncbi:MAG TPA: DinB family protein [Pirellulales bacterium]|nr:DinB family protein [Pirellulales bacterium]